MARTPLRTFSVGSRGLERSSVNLRHRSTKNSFGKMDYEWTYELTNAALATSKVRLMWMS